MGGPEEKDGGFMSPWGGRMLEWRLGEGLGLGRVEWACGDQGGGGED
jgi:hypothetical protein